MVRKEHGVPTRDEVDANRDDPKSLFKFYGINRYSLSSLIRRHVWLAARESLNDPFEMRVFHPTRESDERLMTILAAGWRKMGQDLSKPEVRDRYDAFKQAMLKAGDEIQNCGIFSMSSSPYELLMWSHYADQHKGICVQYARTKNNDLGEALRVDYSDEVAPFLKLVQDGGSIGHAGAEILKRKSRCWQYEREWRYAMFPRPGSEMNRSHQLNADIECVIFGWKTDHEDMLTIRSALMGQGRIRYFQMKPQPLSFALEASPVDLA